MLKIAHIDVETTGRKYWKHSIHQIGLVLEINGDVVLRQQWDCAPHLSAEIEPMALKMSGKSMMELTGAPQAPIIHYDIKNLLKGYANIGIDPEDKYMICGFNCNHFDIPFLEAWWAQCGDDTFWDCFWKGPLDVFTLCAQAFRMERSSFHSFSLEQLAKRLGIALDQDRLHTALYDAEVNREIYKLITNGRTSS